VTQSLLHTALVRGARDNVTLICVKNCPDGEGDNSDEEITVRQNVVTFDEFDLD